MAFADAVAPDGTYVTHMALHPMHAPPVTGGAFAGARTWPDAPLLIVGYDGSRNARAALAYAAARAGAAGQVLIVYVYRSAETWFGAPSYQPHGEDCRPLGHAIAEAAQAEFPLGVRHETLLLRGSPPTALLQIAAERGADEIVIGAHGSDPRRHGLGSVSLALIGEADRPVVIVPDRARRRGNGGEG